MTTLFDAIKGEGFEPILDPSPHDHPDVLGMPDPAGGAVACFGRIIRVVEDNWDYAYDASHEIAEYTWGFKHCMGLFVDQANILARWCKR